MTRVFGILILAFVCLALRADIITLTDGNTYEGEIISETATEIVIKCRYGRVTVPRGDIKSIEKKEPVAAIYRKKLEALQQSDKKSDVPSWIALAEAARKDGANEEARRAWTRVSELDPKNAEAEKALGNASAPAAPAKPAANDAAKAADANNGGAVDKEALAKKVGVSKFNDPNEKPVVCPRCQGTGVAVWLDCNQCLRSPKRGYVNLGDKMELCPKCMGKTQLVGLACDLCKQKGQVMLSQVMPADGGSKPAPSGFQWCTACNGTGVDTWLPCNQCKRSKYPGYNFFGDRLEVCNRCNGAAKLVGVVCATCGGKKVVPEKK